MILKIPVSGSERYFLMLNLFSSFKPYKELNNREKQVLAELFFLNYELRHLDQNKRNRLIFDFDTRREISMKLKISHDSVYNIMSTLRKKGLLAKNKLIDKYTLAYDEEIIFKLNGK